MKFKTIHLKLQRHKRIQSGHLWAFAGEIKEDLKEFEPGEAVALCDARGRLLGRGYVNSHSLIAVRLLTRGDEVWDDGLFRRRIQVAQAYRQTACPGWEAYRLIYSESDGIPGLIVDRYGNHFVIQSLTAGIEKRLDEIVRALIDELNPESILAKGSSSFRALEGLPQEDRIIFGSPPKEVQFHEGDIVFSAYPLDGQKTGFFLDQRFNRWMLKGLVKDKRILDLYSYTGAWGMTSLACGASEAVMVDSSQRATDWGMECAQHNGFADRSLFVKADVSQFLIEAEKNNDLFDVVILDPPGLIPSRAALKKGIELYTIINQQALKVVKPGGIMISCSCSHLMDKDRHLAVIGETAVRERRRIRVFKEGCQSPDHPILPGHPETVYLKCWMLYCE